MKYRILIRVHTARRDAAPLALLARIFERMDCDVLLLCGGSFSTALRTWKPHAAIVGTVSYANQVKELAPLTKVILFDQEGFKNPGMTHAEQMARASMNLDNIDLALFWGKKIGQEFKEFAPYIDRSHMEFVGSPKLDLVRFLPDSYHKKRDSKSVGFVGRFHNLNDHEGHMVTRRILNPGNLERITVQLQGFTAMLQAINLILENTDLLVEIRPHPSEQVESYREYMVEWFGKKNVGRVTIDDSIDFASWAARQKALVSPSSTSFLEAYLLGIPVLNLDRIAGTDGWSLGYAPVVAEWQKGSLVPNNMDELLQLIQEGPIPPTRVEEIELQLSEYCDWDAGVSSCYKAATLTRNLLEGSQFQTYFHLPKFLVNLMDYISFWRAMRRNPLHQNFNYKEGYHKVPAHFDEMVDHILKTTSDDTRPM